jgi:putative hydrolase of the HAD superfamily
MQKKAIIFDLDNTLYPTKKYATIARKNAIRAMIKAGLNTNQKKAYSILKKIIKKYGSNYKYHFDKLIEKLAKNKKHKEKIIVAGIIAYHTTKKQIKPFKNIKTLLKELKKRFKLFIASEGIKKKQWEKILRLKIEKYFDDVFITNKKSIRFYKRIIKKIKLNPKNIIMIGDNAKKDLFYPKRLGIKVIKFKGVKYLKEKLKGE